MKLGKITYELPANATETTRTCTKELRETDFDHQKQLTTSSVKGASPNGSLQEFLKQVRVKQDLKRSIFVGIHY